MTTAGFLWPTKEEYDLAIARWQDSIFDPEVRSGLLAYDNMGILPFGGANLYVCVYKIGNWMVRCFCSKPSHAAPVDICERYMAIDRFCRTNGGRVAALIPVTYLEQGIVVGSRILPMVKMPFLVGYPSLGEFILDHYTNRAVMQQLGDAWFRMIRELETAPMAHGDLDLSNVLVERRDNWSGLTLKLIDYDNMWLPELAGRAQTEFGHVHFQHPDFLPPRTRPYNREMDRFSALVMYISLKALAVHPELYDAWGADESDRLLLGESDYLDASLVGSHIMQLRDLCGPGMQPYIDELLSSLRESRMPLSLPDIANGNSSTYISYRPPTMPRPQAPPSFSAPVFKWNEAVYNVNTNNSYPLQGQTGGHTYATGFYAHQGPVQQSLQPASGQHAGPRSTAKVRNDRATRQFPESDSGLAYPASLDAQNPPMTPKTPFSASNSNPFSTSPNTIPPPVWNVAVNTPLPDFADSSADRRRKIIIIAIIVLLVLIIIAAAIALYIVLTGNTHIGPLTLVAGVGMWGRRKADCKREQSNIGEDGRPQRATPRISQDDGRPYTCSPGHVQHGGDGRPQGAILPLYQVDNGRPQGAAPPPNIGNGDGRPYTTPEEIKDGRPYTTPEEIKDGRPQGATPPIHTAPVPTMYNTLATLSYIVGTGDERWTGVAPCGRPSSHAASLSFNSIPPCGRPSSHCASFERGDV